MLTQASVIVIFGASGDLTFRKLIPALLTLHTNKRLSSNTVILGVSRTKFTDIEYRAKLKQAIEKNEPKLLESVNVDELFANIYYQDIDTGNDADYARLLPRIKKLQERHATGDNILFYLSTPPSLYAKIPANLAKLGLNEQKNGWRRLVIEKPFGYDLQSAKELDASLHKNYLEEQIYRIDHYLGKETVQNMLVFRFANGIFEPLWNHNFIESVEITSAEALGVEKRGGYYDGAGAMRDMFQNHLLQVLSMVAMEPPAAINDHTLRNEVAKVIQCIRPLTVDDLDKNLVLGQYTASKIRGEEVLGYREEEGVDNESLTETYIALKMKIDNWRWSGVPFYIRSGKRLPTKVTEVVIRFKPTPHPVFRKNAPNNKLIIRIQPDEGILFSFGLKEPGAGFESKQVSMDFHYDDLGETRMLDGYARLLLDALKGDATLFSRSDVVEACWKFVQPILDYKNNNPHIYGYAAGTWGPKESDELLGKDGHKWRYPCKNLTDTDYCEL